MIQLAACSCCAAGPTPRAAESSVNHRCHAECDGSRFVHDDPEWQDLIYNGQPLDDERSLQSAGVFSAHHEHAHCYSDCPLTDAECCCCYRCG